MLSVVLRPLGSSCLEGPQNSDGTCSGGTTFNSKAVHDLGLALLDPAGDILITADANPAGAAETVSDFALPAGTGPFAIRVFGGDADNAQLYELEISLTDPDAPPELSIADAEGVESGGRVSFDLNLSTSAGSPVTVDYLVEALTASAGDDFTIDAGIISFPAGSASQQLEVSIADDPIDEANETFRLRLSNPSGAELTDIEAIGTIVDDDLPPVISIADAQISETGGNFEVPITLALESGLTVSVIFSTGSGSADSGADFSAVSRRIIFDPGEIEKVVAVEVIDDGDPEVDEEFIIQLANPSNGEISDEVAMLTILDDDALTLLANSGELGADPGGDGISISWAAVAGRAYTILFSDDLIGWDPVPGAELITATSDSEVFVHQPAPGSRGFYRVVEGYVP